MEIVDFPVSYRSTFTYRAEDKYLIYFLYDHINDCGFPPVKIKNVASEKEALEIYGKAQKNYYEKYPRFLPKGIVITPKKFTNKHFRCYLINLNGKQFYIGSFVTIQDAIRAKKTVIAINVE